MMPIRTFLDSIVLHGRGINDRQGGPPLLSVVDQEVKRVYTATFEDASQYVLIASQCILLLGSLI
jgi:hypothetical protein